MNKHPYNVEVLPFVMFYPLPFFSIDGRKIFITV